MNNRTHDVLPTSRTPYQLLYSVVLNHYVHYLILFFACPTDGGWRGLVLQASPLPIWSQSKNQVLGR